jgi:hypothetical protein
VKQILPELASDATFSDMLVHEAKLAARLRITPTWCRSSTSGAKTRRLFIAMEYVEGIRFERPLAAVLTHQNSASFRASECT